MIAELKEEDAEVTLVDRTLPYNFEKELIENQNKRIFLFDKFRANKEKFATITPKFYAKHEIENGLQIENIGRFEDIHAVPKSVNHMYGWQPKTIRNKFKPTDLNLIFAPKIRCDLTRFQEKM